VAERDLVSFYYSRKSRQAGLIQSIRTLLGGAGVAVFEAMERAQPKERGQIASVVQREFRKLAQHRIEPVLPRSSSKPAQQRPSAGARRR